MINSNNNNRPKFGCGYKKCAKCYWFDNCPLHSMDEEEVREMKKQGRVNPCEFADFDNVKDYYKEFCEYYTPFDDDELAIVEYERALKENADEYASLVYEQQDGELDDYDYDEMWRD